MKASALAALLAGPAWLALPAGAIPRLDLSAYPAPAAGERRWVIQLPGVLPPTSNPAISPNPRDWRVQLIVGQMAPVDCNQTSFQARLRPLAADAASSSVAGAAPRSLALAFRVEAVGPLVSTRMACPAGEPKRQAFVARAGKPFVVPYNASVPIVVYAPKPLELRWRLWKAERQEQRAIDW